jgi:hypothetical protein
MLTNLCIELYRYKYENLDLYNKYFNDICNYTIDNKLDVSLGLLLSF